jgi:hypothetical protein
MKLPEELRLMICESVFQDILNDASMLRFPEGADEEAAHRLTMQSYLKKLLASARTSRAFRAESSRVRTKLTLALMPSTYNEVGEEDCSNLVDDDDDSDGNSTQSEAGSQSVEVELLEDLLWMTWMNGRSTPTAVRESIRFGGSA